jgi:hypothetical protein
VSEPLPADAIADEALTPALSHADAALDRAEGHMKALAYALTHARHWCAVVRAERERAAAIVAARRERG